MLLNEHKERASPSGAMRATINLQEWSSPLENIGSVFVLCSYKVDTDVQTRVWFMQDTKHPALRYFNTLSPTAISLLSFFSFWSSILAFWLQPLFMT